MKKFSFNNSQIIIEEDREQYNLIRQEYRRYADEATKYFEEEYKKNFSSLDQVCKLEEDGCYFLGTKIIDFYIENTVERIIKLGIYTVGKEDFAVNYYSKFSVWDEGFGELYDKFIEIVLEGKALDEYRRLRKDHRGRLVGGGFGIKGAAKGIMVAGAGNMVVGAAHGIVNGIGKAYTSIKQSGKKDKIFNDENTLKLLKSVLYNSVFNMHLQLMENLLDEGYKFNWVTNEEIKKSRIIMENIKGVELEEEKVYELFLQITSLDPYNREIYEYVIKKCGDKNREIEKMAEYFGIDILQYKQKLIQDTYNKLRFNSKEKAIKSKQVLVDQIELIGYEPNNKYIQEIEHKIVMLDRADRTVRGIVLKTTEEAQQAKVEEQEINNILKKEVWENYEELLRIKSIVIEKYTSLVAKQMLKEIDDQLHKLDIINRTVGKIEFLTQEEADKARVEKDMANKLMSFVNLENKASVQETLEEMLNYNSTCINNEKVSKLKSKFKHLEIKERTVRELVYDTKEEAVILKQKDDDFSHKMLRIESIKELEKLKKNISAETYDIKLKNIHLDELDSLINKKKSYKKDNQTRIGKSLAKNIINVILIGIVIGSVFLKVSISEARSDNPINILGYSMTYYNTQVVEELGFSEGIKNGILVYGRMITDTMQDIVKNYLAGFEYELLGNIIWGLVGWIWIVIKYCLIGIAKFIINICILGFVKANIGYYIGYILSIAGLATLSNIQEQLE